MFGGVKIDPGEYIARLQSAKLVESKSSGKLMVRREHVLMDGEFKGMVIFDNMILETPMGLTFIRRWFDQMGYEAPEDPEEIENVVSAVSKDAANVKIQVKHSGDFVNVAVIEVLDEEKEEPASKASGKTATSGGKGKPADDDEDTELLKNLFIFCKAQDIDTEKDDTIDVLCERIKEYDWPKEELTDDEVEMFEEAGISDVIIEPKKAKKKKRGAR